MRTRAKGGRKLDERAMSSPYTRYAPTRQPTCARVRTFFPPGYCSERKEGLLTHYPGLVVTVLWVSIRNCHQGLLHLTGEWQKGPCRTRLAERFLDNQFFTKFLHLGIVHWSIQVALRSGHYGMHVGKEKRGEKNNRIVSISLLVGVRLNLLLQ